MSPSRGAREKSRPWGRPKLWAFRLAAITLLPALLLVILEVGLQTVGYGYPTDFFLNVRARDAYTANPRFGWRFFPRSLSRAPVMTYLPVPKPPGSYRIFVLGGSAAQGTPEPSFNFGRILKAMLEEGYPGTRFEVVNAAMTAINSHVVLPITRDCARYEPDLFVVYMGNNEVVGPFGPGTVFNRSSRRLAMIRSGLWLKTTKVGQAAQALAGSVSGRGGQAADWRGMEMFLERQLAAGDPRLDEVYQHFEQNLEDICSVATDAGAEVVLCTLPVNLKDSAPFASLHRPDLEPARQANWERAYTAGQEEEAQGDNEAALARYHEAARIDDGFADLAFRMAGRNLALGRGEEARAYFKRARDLDALRFRADTRINDVIRDVATGRAGDGVVLVDAEQAFEVRHGTGHGIPGREIFYDHVHMNFEGNYELARAVFEKAAGFVSQAPDAPRAAAPTPASLDRCAERLAYTGPDRHRMAMSLWTTMGRAPFTHQFDHRERREQAHRELRELVAYTAPEALEKAEAVYRRAVEWTKDDLQLRRNFAQLLHERGALPEAEQQWRRVLDRLPDNADAHADLGAVLLAMGRRDEALRHFELAIQSSAVPAEYCNRVGESATTAGALDLAERFFRQGLMYENGSAKLHNNLGSTLFQQERTEDALNEFFEAVRFGPLDVVYRNNLGVALFLRDRPVEAGAQLEEAVRLDPFYVPARDRLALVLARQGRLGKAEEQLTEALRLDPGNPEVQAHYTELMRLRGRPAGVTTRRP